MQFVSLTPLATEMLKMTSFYLSVPLLIFNLQYVYILFKMYLFTFGKYIIINITCNIIKYLNVPNVKKDAIE